MIDTLNWTTELTGTAAVAAGEAELGKVLFVGAGSVGSAAAYFLTLLGAKFEAQIVDMDCVKIENLSRSPVFAFDDRCKPKVSALERFLLSAAIPTTVEAVALDEANVWRHRQAGEPDLMISAANERDVRREIETQLPPLQVYATTGRNWQVALLRHVPLRDPCSCCVFGTAQAAPTSCATATVSVPGEGGVEQVDASLPFLSFAAGFMAAVDAIRLALAIELPTANRVFCKRCSQATPGVAR
jgi:molybdopterin/thiamine biosynthesis adenylyltransferase